MSGLTAFERLTPAQIDAMATTLWDFVWNHDPNDPEAFKRFFPDQSKAAKDNYRNWARAIFLAAMTGEAQHTWNRDFPSDYGLPVQSHSPNPTGAVAPLDAGPGAGGR